MEGFEKIIAMLNGCGLKMDVWVDGSFLTEKLNPDDIDFAARVEEADWRAANAQQKTLCRWVNMTDLKPAYRCDAYVFVELAPGGSSSQGAWEWGRAYWLRQFGFTRDPAKPKGMAVMKLPFIVI
jgi:hypothetical protein